jgi:chromate reductase
MNILALSGSNRKDSFNTMLLHNLQALASSGMEIEIADTATIPLYNQDVEHVSFPASVHALKEKIERADGIIIATPEYNRSIPGTLKNVIDWVSRPYGKNSFAGKPTIVAGVSVGKLGTAIAQSHLRQILMHLDARVIGQPELYLGPAHELFDTDGNLMDDSTKELLVQALEVLRARVSVSAA